MRKRFGYMVSWKDAIEKKWEVVIVAVVSLVIVVGVVFYYYSFKEAAFGSNRNADSCI